MNILTGDALRTFCSPVRGYRKRECFQQLHDFINGGQCAKVFILYGLWQTGKTTMMQQAIAELPDAAFIQITESDTLAEVDREMMMLWRKGIRHVFINEVTLMSDFIQRAAVFSDIYAALGMKIVLSGTDSFGFLLAERRQLYDRCIMLHTTFIPYREFESVLGFRGINEYIRYGGTMNPPFPNAYAETAISHNIQHSLSRCKYHRLCDKECLALIDATTDIDVLHLPNVNTRSIRTVNVQPGLSHNMTLKDVVLLETKMAYPEKQVFVLQFPVGEFDMVVFDPDAGSCQIFEIKHSKEVVPQQYRHLINEEKCAMTEHRYGPITGKFVLYRGDNQVIGDIQYLNVEEYLKLCGN